MSDNASIPEPDDEEGEEELITVTEYPDGVIPAGILVPIEELDHHLRAYVAYYDHACPMSWTYIKDLLGETIRDLVSFAETAELEAEMLPTAKSYLKYHDNPPQIVYISDLFDQEAEDGTDED